MHGPLASHGVSPEAAGLDVASVEHRWKRSRWGALDRLLRLTVEKEEKREKQTRRQERRTLKKEAVRCQGSTVNADRLLDSWRAYIMEKALDQFMF